ncbi:MAG: cytochrome c biogenesis protein CcdA [bacterium]
MTPIDLFAFAPAAFFAGVLMFFAPCTLPLVPGYLAFIAGVPYGEVGAHDHTRARRRILVNAGAFVIGFSFIFILLGVFAGAIGGLLGPWRVVLARGAGLVVILFGLTMMGVLRIPAFSRERRLGLPRFLTVGRPESSVFIGGLFALGWSPCIGPILGTVLLYASANATLLQGGLLLGIFSLGLGIPFLLSALLINKASSVFVRIAPKLHTLSVVGGALLVCFGFLLLMGWLGSLIPSQFIESHMVGYNWFLAHL